MALSELPRPANMLHSTSMLSGGIGQAVDGAFVPAEDDPMILG